MDDKKTQSSSAKTDKRNYTLYILLALTAVVLFVLTVMLINSRKPDALVLSDVDKKIKGAYFIRVNQALTKQMHGNWLPNDLFWPTLLLDNMPNFQIGELEVVRYNVRVLRDNLSRMRTTDKLDPYAEGAFTSLSNDPYKWWFPSAESKWELCDKNLGSFHQNLVTGKSHFYPRADNLKQLLEQYASLIIKRALSVEEHGKKDPGVSGLVDIDIPWYEIDDNFYYAQGVAYALDESFKAIRIDFIDVLKDKNSLKLVDKILEDFGRCNFEPLIVFNGGLSSIFANHSLNLSGVFNDARQKINSLIEALKVG
jgi:hypothetical protein